jgi:nicotinamidase/pyrazinamidase
MRGFEHVGRGRSVMQRNAVLDHGRPEPARMSDSDLLRPRTGDALLLVDVQQDFLPGGSLAVPEGGRVIAPLRRCIDLFASRALPVFATRDWHPRDHCSFRTHGGPWPEHCVAGSAGAAISPALRLPASVQVVSKGTLATQEAYSGFTGTELEQRLNGQSVRRLFVGGLATDYCVAETVQDARRRGFEVVVFRDAIAAVDAHAGDGDRAIERMTQLGALVLDSAQLS